MTHSDDDGLCGLNDTMKAAAAGAYSVLKCPWDADDAVQKIGLRWVQRALRSSEESLPELTEPMMFVAGKRQGLDEQKSNNRHRHLSLNEQVVAGKAGDLASTLLQEALLDQARMHPDSVLAMRLLQGLTWKELKERFGDCRNQAKKEMTEWRDSIAERALGYVNRVPPEYREQLAASISALQGQSK